MPGLVQCLMLIPLHLQFPNGLLHGLPDFLFFYRLQDIMAYAKLHGLTGEFILPISGKNYDLRFQLFLPDFPYHADSVQQRHFNIREDQIRMDISGDLKALFTVSCSACQPDSILFPWNQLLHAFPLQFFVIHQKQCIHHIPAPFPVFLPSFSRFVPCCRSFVFRGRRSMMCMPSPGEEFIEKS